MKLATCAPRSSSVAFCRQHVDVRVRVRECGSALRQERLLARQVDDEVAKWQKSVNGSTTPVEHYSILSPPTSVEHSQSRVASMLRGLPKK